MLNGIKGIFVWCFEEALTIHGEKAVTVYHKDILTTCLTVGKVILSEHNPYLDGKKGIFCWGFFRSVVEKMQKLHFTKISSS